MHGLQLDGWHDFYLIIGGGAAGLMGLMFVVVTLSPRVIATRGARGIRTFVTPTVVFFTSALVISALMSLPHLGPTALAVMLGILGLGGAIYMLELGVHKQLRESDLPSEDWFWYFWLPVSSYVSLAASAGLLWSTIDLSLILVAASSLLFTVIGVRNSWDLVLWMARRSQDRGDTQGNQADADS